jgi:protein required for attachment to host cells
MEVKIDEAAMNQAVTDAIIKSAIGKKLDEIVSAALSDLGGYNSPMKKAVEEVVHDEIVKLVKTKYREQIEKSVQASLTDKFVDDIWRASWDALIEKSKKW